MPGRPEYLVISYSGLFGGAERILVDVAPALEGAVALACPSGALEQRARAAGLAVLALRERRLEVRPTLPDRISAATRLAAHSVEIARIVARERPRVVIAWGMPSVVAAAIALSGRRRHPGLIFAHNDLLPRSGFGQAVRLAARRCDYVVTLSEAIAHDLDPGRRLDGRLAVVHPGVDLGHFTPTPLPPETQNVLVLGAIVGWKRPDLALETAAEAAKEIPRLRLTLGGEPLDSAGWGLLDALRRRAEAPDLTGRVSFPGRIDPRRALAEASCLLHCADEEPFGLAVVEALAAGRPVVAPAAGGPLETVTEDCGRLYPPGDPAGAARALVDVLSPPERTKALAEAARRRAEAGFGLAASRRRFAEIARLVAERSPKTPDGDRRPA